jgi:hypothetical protein
MKDPVFVARGRMARNKGARGEREIIKLLEPIVKEECTKVGKQSLILQRNSLQSRFGGSDLAGCFFLAAEVKYCESIQIASWWNQTVAQVRGDQVPVLFYRKNLERWKCRMFGKLPLGDGRHVTTPCDISIGAFLIWFRHRLILELASPDWEKKTGSTGF